MTTLSRPIIVDTREQTPWFQHQVPGFEFSTERRGLPTGDYVLQGLEHVCIIERKSLPDLVGCVGHGRERFERELCRLKSETENAWLFIEGTVSEVELGQYRGQIAPSAVLGTVLAWSHDYGLKIWWGGSPQSCEQAALRLFGALERRVGRGEIEAA